MSGIGAYPEEHEVVEAGDQVRVRNRFYEFTHSLDRGGAVTSIRLLQAGGENLLREACACELGLAGAGKPFSPGRCSGMNAQRGAEPVLGFESELRDPDGKACGVVLKVTCRHRWGHVKVRQELVLPDGGVEANRLLLHRWVLAPRLTHYAVRPGAPAEAGSYPPFAMGLCQWGRFSPGTAFNCTVQSRFVPRYVAFAEPGRQGLEWFPGSSLAQWDYQVTGASGHASLQIEPRANPPGIALNLCALDIPMGAVKLRGRLVFDSYIGVPILAGRAHQPFLHATFRRKPWPADDAIAGWAARGVRTAHFHHDGDSNGDGIFWRDGTYPPFEPGDMKEFDRVIATCHRHGIRVATYFSNKELHPTVQAYKDHGTEWARLPEDRRQVLHNHYLGDEYGAQMCLKSGWLEWFKGYVDTVLSRHDLDGTYYDWNVGLYCHNPRHVGAPDTAGPDPAAGLGAWAFSPIGHWDIDELLELMLWTRRRIGPDGLSIVHTTMCPMAATENFADCVVAMEWGYSQLSTGAPALDDLPMEWNFMGSRSRGVIGYGCLDPSAPERIQRQMTLRCLLTGVAPWPARDLDLELFAPLARRDLGRFAFHDWRNTLAPAPGEGTATAVYTRPEQWLVLAGELRGDARQANCAVHLPPGALADSERLRVRAAGDTMTVSRAQLSSPGVPVRLPADGWALLEVEPAT